MQVYITHEKTVVTPIWPQELNLDILRLFFYLNGFIGRGVCTEIYIIFIGADREIPAYLCTGKVRAQLYISEVEYIITIRNKMSFDFYSYKTLKMYETRINDLNFDDVTTSSDL